MKTILQSIFGRGSPGKLVLQLSLAKQQTPSSPSCLNLAGHQSVYHLVAQGQDANRRC